ncbi:MAG: hypothetical protein IPI87_04150 [Betaproteobacteria bacterium]|nr:hypothetical protein [Betaproteobacteria bacterium]
MNTIFRTSFLAFRVFAVACLLAMLATHPVWAVGGGSPDPSGIPVLQALRVELDGLDQDFLELTASVETADLPELKQLADELARIDAHFALASVGGGTPDPGETTLNQVLLALRAETVALRNHVGKVLSAVAGNPVFEQITVTKTLRFMQATTRMLIARIDYALPGGTVPVPDQ